ncbi:MAG: hypothetical protein QG608_2271 [Actinomycetota bacterium]|nr:hypothetical protein [Actinomycetota bacterium]
MSLQQQEYLPAPARPTLPIPPFLFVVLCGFAAGIAASLAPEAPFLVPLAVHSGFWVAATAWVGRRSGAMRVAVFRGPAFLLAAVFGLYGSVALQRGQINGLMMLVLLLLGSLVGPVVGVLGQISVQGGKCGAAVSGLFAGLLAGEAAFVLLSQAQPEDMGLLLFDMAASLAFICADSADARRRGMFRWIPAAGAVGVLAFLAVPALAHVLLG